jgi:hypothetical protein
MSRTSAWWYEAAHEDLASARRSFESAGAVERVGGPGWRKRQAFWFANAAAWLVLADDARRRARDLVRHSPMIAGGEAPR